MVLSSDPPPPPPGLASIADPDECSNVNDSPPPLDSLEMEQDSDQSLTSNANINSQNPSSDSLKVGEEDSHQYLNASNTIVSNFVSVKLSSDHNFHLWETQMSCLINSHMHDIVFLDEHSLRIEVSTSSLKNQYDNLLKGWIFGSLSEDVLKIVINCASAEDVWKKLDFLFNPKQSSRQVDAAPTKPKAKPKIKDITRLKLYRATMEGHWWEVEIILRNDPDAIRDEINDGGETVLHVAVGTYHKYLVKKLLDFINNDDDAEEILGKRSLDGSTALHIAAITGNTYAAGLLIQRMTRLLGVEDCVGCIPMLVALQNHHYETSLFLLKAGRRYERSTFVAYVLLHTLICAKRYDLAIDLLDTYQSMAVYRGEEILEVISKNFPSGLKDYWETHVYPSSMGDIREKIVNETSWLFTSLTIFNSGAKIKRIKGVLSGTVMMLLVPVLMLLLVYQLVRYLMLLIYLSFSMIYLLLWKIAIKLVPPIKNIEKKKREWENAKKFLKLVCDKIDEADRQSKYNASILEAARQNAYEVVEEILSRSPDAIGYRDQNENDIIQLAVIHRSENIYNIIYKIRGRDMLYSRDQVGNNILHMVGRLAPSSKLERRTGAALQLQLELQWREEVKKLMVSFYHAQTNMYDETPDMVFTREHENLLKEGEKWMKTTAESCSITAALITTIVFAAAITVPGGSNQETGIPLLTKEAAFVIFAIADTISLCASTVSLLMFVSILTARFAEQDFLIKLPRQLFIGLCSLLLSMIAMMVAFGMTVFLVFCHQKAWMLAPIGGLVFLPITIFVVLQFPLMVDLFKSTYVPIFGKKSSGYTDWSHPGHILTFVDKLNERWSNLQRLPQHPPAPSPTPKGQAYAVETALTSASADAIQRRPTPV